MSGRVFTTLIGVILIIIGALLTMDRMDLIDFEFWDFIGDMWPLILIGAGLWLIYDQTRKDKKWKDAVTGTKSSKAFGDMVIKPNNIDSNGANYSMGFGDLDLDLTATGLQTGENKIDVSMGCGDVFVMLPKDRACKVVCTCGLGDITIFDKKDDGFGVSRDYKDENYDTTNTKLFIHAKCGLGDIKIKRDK